MVKTELVRRIRKTFEDIRAEVIVSDLLENGLHIDDIFIRFIGQLHRPRRRDISHVQTAKNDRPRTQIELILNRDSIYDTLPEGLFHQPANTTPMLSVSSMVDEYRRQKKEEEEARQFFAPFERELFLQKVFTESEEFKQLLQIQQSRLSRVVLQKLGIDSTLPKTFTSKLLRMVPYSSQIAGNLTRTEHVFSLLLNDQIKIGITSFSEPEKSTVGSYLGHSTLGADLIIGSKIVPDHHFFNLKIGPLSKTKALLYEAHQWKAKALQTMIEFFIPVEWDLDQQVLITNDDSKSFLLNSVQTDARLGYTTSLQA